MLVGVADDLALSGGWNIRGIKARDNSVAKIVMRCGKRGSAIVEDSYLIRRFGNFRGKVVVGGAEGAELLGWQEGATLSMRCDDDPFVDQGV